MDTTPRLPAQAKAAPTPLALGLYIHVPFCAATCDFCAFYQKVPTVSDMERYVEAIARETQAVEWRAPPTTVYWGGGTPGLLPPRHLARLAAIVRERAGDGLLEWTVELAPASVTADRLAVLRGAGVTRVSLGVQSFHPPRLDSLGRPHTVDQVHRAYDRIRSAGFASVNLDLMFALPGQTAAERAADVRAAVALAPDHLSTYCLTLEEDTALWLRLAQGKVKLDPEKEAQFYRDSWEQLAAAGFAQYEISNFARPGHECLHNLNTWRMAEWVGLGPSAASQYGGFRGANVADLDKWLAGVGRGDRMTEDRVALTEGLLAEDALIFGLRMNRGVDLGELRQRHPGAPWAVFEQRLGRLAAEGLVVREGPRVRLAERGRLLADAIGAELMVAA